MMLLFTSIPVPVLLTDLLGRGLLGSRRRDLFGDDRCSGSGLILHFFLDLTANPWPVEVDDQRLQAGEQPTDEEVQP